VKKRIHIVVPSFNEDATTLNWSLARLVNIAQSSADVRILVVDDGSTLQGSNRCLQLWKKETVIEIFFMGINSGYGAALRKGLEIAREQKSDWAILIDSELSMRETDLENLIKQIQALPDESKIAYIKGSRYLPESDFSQLSGKRKFYSVTANYFARVMTFGIVNDPTTGFRAINLRQTQNMDLKENDFSSIPEEVYFLMARQKLRKDQILNIPYSYQVRKTNDRESSFNYTFHLVYKYFRYLFLTNLILISNSIRRIANND